MATESTEKTVNSHGKHGKHGHPTLPRELGFPTHRHRLAVRRARRRRWGWVETIVLGAVRGSVSSVFSVAITLVSVGSVAPLPDLSA